MANKSRPLNVAKTEFIDDPILVYWIMAKVSLAWAQMEMGGESDSRQRSSKEEFSYKKERNCAKNRRGNGNK